MDRYHAFAVALAEECGEIARRHFSLDIQFEPKGDNSPVTVADVAINRLVIERCAREFPDIPVLGEEEDSKHGSGGNELLWVCDPIDGTAPYAFGMSASTFCLALVRDGEPVVGVVYDFMHDRMFHAVKGGGAYLNDLPLSRSKSAPLKLVSYEWWHSAAVKMHGFHELMFDRQYQVPNYTSTGYMSMQVAQGRIAAVVYAGKHQWDVAAVKVIAEEAGCIVRSLKGVGQRYDTPLRGAVIAHPQEYETVIQAVRQSIEGHA